jgi:hypothetical protein
MVKCNQKVNGDNKIRMEGVYNTYENLLNKTNN